MAYPKAHPARMRRAGAAVVPASSSSAVLEYWAADDTFQASVDGAAGRRERRQRVRLLRRAAVRQRTAALRPPADRLRQGRRAALPDDARPARRAPVRLGLPRPAGRGRGREAARHQAQGRDRGDGRRRVQRGVPHLGAALHRASGSEYVTRQARWVDFDNDYKTLDLDYMESVMWAFKIPVGQGSGLRGLPGAVVLLALRDAAVEHRDQDGRRLPRPAGPGGHGRRSGCETGELALVWTTTPWTLPSNLALAVHPDVDYVVVRARTASATCSPRPGSPRTPRSWARTTPVVARVQGQPTWSAAATRRRSTSSPARPNAHQVLAADYVTTEDGTGIVHIAPAYGEDDKAVTDAAGDHPGRRPVDDRRASSTAQVPPYAGHARLRGQQADHRATSRRAARCCATRPTTTPTRTAGAATTR